ncbi:MAG: (2Fe-2S)-binding protein [Clostridia bacterium]|nr:(2Fe-2S)-binding protein [Clostridia bacterium]
MKINLIVNHNHYDYYPRPDEYLIESLRKLGFQSVKKGCDTTSCGVCSVIVDGQLVPSCSYLTSRCDQKEVLTVEGIPEEARHIAEFITAEGVDQCGFCSPGHVMAIHALKLELKNPTMEEIKHYLAGNMCRCSGYEGQHRAIKKMMEVE